jgi:hypothetical protein
MRIDFLPEPELEFGVNHHIDIRFGLMNYGPVDYASALAPKEIRLGIVGTTETVEGVQRWLERCREEIPAKASRLSNLFPRFPGFRPDVGFYSTLVMATRLQRTIHPRTLKELRAKTSVNQFIDEAVDLFLAELSYLASNTNADVLMCALPQIVLDAGDVSDEADSGQEEKEVRLNFHHLLKAKVMSLHIPIQLIVPSTYDETKRRRQKKAKDLPKTLQDEATRAWNLHTALYYKAKGVPWRLIRDPQDYTTCYVGVSFYEALDRSSLLTSVAQVFNERGEGVVVRGGPAKLSKEDRQVHLTGEDAERLLGHALTLYREEHKNFPARLVLHKTSQYNQAELDGFETVARKHHVELIDLVSVSESTTRLFRAGSYPPLRGTFVSLDNMRHVLYTRGSVDFYSTYPGLYVPRPLAMRCDYTEQTPRALAQEILALSKMNWNNTQFDGAEPITVRAARQVGSILKYIPPDGRVASSYRFYM